MLITLILIQKPDFIEKHQWQNRVLLVFSTLENENTEMQITELMNQKDELLERDLILYQIDEKSINELISNNEIEYSSRLVYEYYRVPQSEFRVILIGKDGGNKLSKNQYIEPSYIFDLIDSMPMRQSEMRRKNN